MHKAYKEDFHKRCFILLTAFALLCNILSPISSLAHHEGTVSGPGIAGPIITIPARTLPKGKAFVSAGLKYTNFDNFSRAKVRRLLGNRQTTGQISHSLAPSIGVGYGLTDDWDVYVNLPYQFKYGLKETSGGEFTNFGNSIGLGDITVLSQYRFYKSETKKLFASAIGGVNIPTGQTDEKTRQGEFFGNDDQPGSGTWDPYMGFAISKSLGAFSLDANGLYRLALEGDRDQIIGDTVNYNLALSYRVGHYHKHSDSEHTHSHLHPGDTQTHLHTHDHPEGDEPHNHDLSRVGRFLARVFPETLFGHRLSWDLITELNGTWQERPFVDGVEERNHGGNIVLATEGIRAIIDERLVTNFAVSLPVIDGLNGSQPTPSPSLIFGLSYLL